MILLIVVSAHLMIFGLDFSSSFFMNLPKSYDSLITPVWVGASLDSFVIFFSLTLVMVGILVFSFADCYMDSYNNHKLLAGLMFFIGSMILLIFSSSPMLLMIGWDLLGLTSIFLIMFYPNKKTLYNSLLTMSFNRVGDVLMVFYLCLMLAQMILFFWLVPVALPFLPGLVALVCSMTKSAQLPFSSWLPAAMSAPTPISALVHSSTLVTAGVFLLFKCLDCYWSEKNFLIFWSLSTFLLGGFLATTEKDLKKVIAYSTLSQISMIIFFLSVGCFLLSCLQILLHALYKSCLFCLAGFMFVKAYSDQFKHFFHSKQLDSMINSMIFLSIFSMMGLYYSFTFFSKDLVLNFMWSSSKEFVFLCLMFGALFTVMYSCSILKCSIFSFENLFSMLSKKIPMFVFLLTGLIFSFSFLFISSIMPVVWVLGVESIFSPTDVFFISLIFISSTTLGVDWLEKNFSSISKDLFFLKFFIYSFFAVKAEELLKILFSESLIFKPVLTLKVLGAKIWQSAMIGVSVVIMLIF